MEKENRKQLSTFDSETKVNCAFSSSNREILTRYKDVAETIARLFGSGCEIVIHSLEDMAHSVVMSINGNVTGRKIGSPITNLGLEVLNKSLAEKEDIIGPYFSKTKAGKSIKSAKMLIRDDKGIPIGLLCINFDLSVPLSRFLEEFSPSGKGTQSSENFAPDVGELVAQAVADELGAISGITGISPTGKNRTVVSKLGQRGVFEIKGSVELVAGELGVTTHTIYKYLREMRRGR